MSVRELNRSQLVQLKQDYLCKTQERVFWSELAEADDLVSDEVIFSEYAGFCFSEDDFV